MAPHPARVVSRCGSLLSSATLCFQGALHQTWAVLGAVAAPGSADYTKAVAHPRLQEGYDPGGLRPLLLLCLMRTAW